MCFRRLAKSHASFAASALFAASPALAPEHRGPATDPREHPLIRTNFATNERFRIFLTLDATP